ncbi:hypothetical protein ACNF42_02030 [Cuniculiplasma sp. SKW3]|uniref:hypothetical protein n=1 Tax=Cuniculiplasma sp. SKW3 TaxID=3400170 RepID=UPI003FD034C4
MNDLKMDEGYLEIAKERSASFFDVYNSYAIVLIGNCMESTMKRLIPEIQKSNLNARVGVYVISEEENETKITIEDLRNMDFFKYNQNETKLYSKEFLEITDENGNAEMDDEAVRISNPDIRFLKFRALVTDEDKRRGAEIAAGYIDASWSVILISDTSEGFALDMHSTLISKIPEAFSKSVSITFRGSKYARLGFQEVSELKHIQDKSKKFITIKGTNLVTDDSVLLKTDRKDIDDKIVEEVRKVFSSRPSIH